MTSRHYALVGIFAPILFWSTYFIMAGARPEYNLYTKAVSELGSLDAPNKWVWNCLGYIVPGLLISIYAYGFFSSTCGHKASRVPMIGFVASGLLMAMSGVFPGDFNNKQSTTMLLHSVGSFGSYLFFLVGAFSYPKEMKKKEYWSRTIKPVLVFTWLTILFGAWPFVFPDAPAVGQRLVFLFFFLVVFYTALKLYQAPATRQ